MSTKPTYEELERRVKELKQEVVRCEQTVWELQAILDQIPVSIFQKDRNGRTIRTSKFFNDLMGLSKEEVVGKTTIELFPQYGKTMMADDQEVIKSGKPKLNIIEQYDTPEGTRWSRTGKTPLMDNQGNLIGIIGYSADITEQILAEDAQRESEEKYRLLIENIPSVTWITNEHGITTFISPNVERIYGYSQEEIYKGGDSIWFDRIHPDDKDLVRESFERLFSTNKGYDIEYRIQRKNGEWIWLHDMAISAFQKDDFLSAYGAFSDITQRKKAEKALKESEERFRNLFENTGTATFVSEEDMTISQANSKAVELSGYSKDDLIGKMKTSDFIADEDLDRLATYHIKRIHGGTEVPMEYEFNLIDKNGKEKTVFIQVGTISETKQSIASIVDITERKEMEKKLQAIFNHRFQLTGLLAPDGKLLMANETVCNMVGAERKDLEGKYLWELPHWSHSKELQSEVRDAVELARKGNTLSFETTHPVSKGNIHFIDFSLTPVLNEKGEIIFIVPEGQDITTKKQNEEALKWELSLNTARGDISRELLSQKYFNLKTISDISLNYAMQLTQSEHGFVSSIDSRTKENIGHTLTNMLGEQCLMEDQRISFPIGSDDKYPTLWGHALNTGKSFYTNEPENHQSSTGIPEGHITIRNFLAAPVLVSNRPAGLIALANSERDYTESDIEAAERLAEIFALALHKYHYELDRENMEKQIQQMQKMEAIGTLAGGIAHDFNNILSPIMIHAEMAMMDINTDNPVQHNLEEIFNSGQRARALVRQILAFSRQSEEERHPIRIRPVIEEALKLLRASLPTTIEIQLDFKSESDTVLADPTQIYQILMNLCTNASHAMRAKGGVLQVRLSNLKLDTETTEIPNLSPGSYLRLTVSDTGEGMNQAIMNRIFDPYFSTKEKGEGTGLGLSMVHGIVKSHGGAITVDSELGKGTIFEVYLPHIERRVVAETEAVEQIQRGNETILLVDDEKAIIDPVQKALERLGYQIVARTSSIEALEFFHSQPEKIDIVITDQTMPDITGDDLARELVALRSDLPIILCTGFSKSINEEKAKAIGIQEFIMKPIIISELAKAIRKLLDKS